jgi:hypothetical protein
MQAFVKTVEAQAKDIVSLHLAVGAAAARLRWLHALHMILQLHARRHAHVQAYDRKKAEEKKAKRLAKEVRHVHAEHSHLFIMLTGIKLRSLQNSPRPLRLSVVPFSHTLSPSRPSCLRQAAAAREAELELLYKAAPKANEEKPEEEKTTKDLMEEYEYDVSVQKMGLPIALSGQTTAEQVHFNCHERVMGGGDGWRSGEFLTDKQVGCLGLGSRDSGYGWTF